MAAVGHLTAQEEYVSSFVNDNPYPVTGEDVLPPANSPPQQSSNHKALTGGRKRKVADNQQQNSIPYKQPAQQFFCEICNVQLNSLSQASQHKLGKVHKFNAMKLDSFNSVKDSPQGTDSSNELDHSSSETIILKSQTKQNDGINLECIICRKRFNSRTQAQQHFNGQMHKRKLQTVLGSNKMDPALPQNVSLPSTEQPSERALVQEQLQETLLINDTPNEVVSSSENIETNDLYCEFCGLAVNSKMQMDMHLKGTKHKNAVTRAALSTVNNSMKSLPPMVLYCDDCHTNVNSQSQLLQHLASSKHMNRVQFRGAIRGRGHSQRRGRGGSRGAQSHKGRGRGSVNPMPPISASFVKESSNFTHMGNYGYPFNPPGQATNSTINHHS